MSLMDTELHGQPASWRRAAELAVEMRGRLPAPGIRLAITGCGTSYYIASAAAWLREAGGGGETDAFPASQMLRVRPYEAILVISRSGTTTEVLRVAEEAGRSRPVVAITAVKESPLAELAAAVIVLDFADEQSVVQTRFATSALAMLRAHGGEDVSVLADQASRALGSRLPKGLEDVDQFVFLGDGAGAALASEAALKLRETAQAWSEAYPSLEFRHGPIAVAGPRSCVWALNRLGPELRADIASTGAMIVDEATDPMVELVRVQRAASALAGWRNLDPDHPRHLNRSVVLS